METNLNLTRLSLPVPQCVPPRAQQHLKSLRAEGVQRGDLGESCRARGWTHSGMGAWETTAWIGLAICALTALLLSL
jgi:hypothetical protein